MHGFFPYLESLDLGTLDRKRLTEVEMKKIIEDTKNERNAIPPARAEYPNNHQKRRYNPEWEVKFPWLRYSVTEDGAYCAYCFVFASSTPSPWEPLICAPFKDWKNAGGSKRGILTNHELSKTHQGAMLAAANFTAVSRREIESVKESLSRGYSEIVKKNRKIRLAVLDVVIVLAKRGIAFRGNWDSAAMKENGNFEFFIKWLAKYDESLSEHLSTAAKNARYLSPQIQNEMINCLGESIRNALVTDIRKSKFISVMADESSDVSMTEQLAVCIRYLNASSDDEVRVNEVFLGFVELPTTDASTITDSLLGNLSKWGLDTERLRGMGFDGASNMSGTQSGVQARITQRYPKAKYFTHCSSHCLNLVIVASCNKVQEIKNFMTTFQELSFFFSYSPKRKEILKQNFSTSSDAEDLLADCPKEEHEERLFKSALNRESLPTLSDTRWLSRVDSISTLLASYSKIYDAVAQVKAQSKGKSSHDASGFLHGMEQFQYIISAVLTQYVLGYTRPLSVLLQSKTCDLVKAHTEARNLVSLLAGLRTEEKFGKLYARAVKVAQTIEVLPSKPRTTVRQMHRANAPAESIPDFYRYESSFMIVFN